VICKGVAALKAALKEKMMLQRVAVYVAGLFVLAWGVAFSINSDLGVSPVNTLPVVVARIFDTYPGMWTTGMMALFMLAQIVILRRKYKPVNLTQILFSFAFGVFLDATLWMMRGLQFPTYFGRFAMLIISIALISSGLTLIIGAKLVPLPPEGLCMVIAGLFKNGKFHVVKIIFDSSLVVAGAVLAFAFLGGMDGVLISVREGTVISAVAIGKMIPYCQRLFAPLLSKFDGI